MQRYFGGRNEEDVADVLQETVLQAYEHLTELRKIEFFRTWLLRILINNCNKLYNSRKRFCAEEAAAEQGQRDSYPAEDDFFQLLELLRHSLEENQG